jgi:hypothetical protein
MFPSQFHQEKHLNTLRLIEKKQELRYRIQAANENLSGNGLVEKLLTNTFLHRVSWASLLKKGKTLLGLSRLMLSFGKRIVHLFSKSHETN